MSPLKFAEAAGERAVKTFAQALLALLGADTTGIVHAAWTTALSVAGMAAVLSLLTSLASLGGPALGGPATAAPADTADTLPAPTWPEPPQP